MTQQFDYIITGVGCAGLSLLARMMQEPFFATKKILIIDKDNKQNNDRTWCFWEQQQGFFQHLVCHEWKQVDFYSDTYSARFDMLPYTYKMIRGIDLYRDVLSKAHQQSNITIIYEDVLNIACEDNYAAVKTANDMYSADYIFNSIHFENIDKLSVHYLLQHFKGWVIKTTTDCFDEQVATFMDFRTSPNGDSFFYVLPTSANRALIEYTFFNKKLAPADEYKQALVSYIDTTLHIDHYSIEHEETGVIPMTDYNFSPGEKNVINIGSAAGKTKPSSGFTFQFIQKHSDEIINALISQQSPLLTSSFAHKRFNLYDSTILDVLDKNKLKASDVFALLFKKNSLPSILRFLDNESKLKDELKIMHSMPLSIFTPSFFKQMLSYKLYK